MGEDEIMDPGMQPEGPLPEGLPPEAGGMEPMDPGAMPGPEDFQAAQAQPGLLPEFPQEPMSQEPAPNAVVEQTAMMIVGLIGQVVGRKDLNLDVQAKAIYTLAQAYEKLSSVQAQPQEISAEDQLQLEVVKLQFEQQMEEQKFQLEVQKMQMEMQMKQEQAQMDNQLKQEQFAIDSQIKQQQSEQQMRHQDESHQINHTMAADKHEHTKQMDQSKLQLAAKQQANSTTKKDIKQ